MDSITSSARSDAREVGNSLGHHLLASILVNDGTEAVGSRPVDRLHTNGEALLAHLQRDLAVATLALARSHRWLDCLAGMCREAQTVQDKETQPLFIAVDRLRAATKSFFPDPMDQPLHKVALALSTSCDCEGPPFGKQAVGRSPPLASRTPPLTAALSLSHPPLPPPTHTHATTPIHTYT